ncbi:MAG TPA: hypothetical protein PK228_16550 [Saprospiraceae bacterium]|nr:hypothetical protein [Saprospiraceae bacterium]
MILKLYILIPALFLSAALFAQKPGKSSEKSMLLPTGWSLTPAGISLPLGDLPLNITVSPNKKYLAVTNNGQGFDQTIFPYPLRSTSLSSVR